LASTFYGNAWGSSAYRNLQIMFLLIFYLIAKAIFMYKTCGTFSYSNPQLEFFQQQLHLCDGAILLQSEDVGIPNIVEGAAWLFPRATLTNFRKPSLVRSD